MFDNYSGGRPNYGDDFVAQQGVNFVGWNAFLDVLVCTLLEDLVLIFSIFGDNTC